MNRMFEMRKAGLVPPAFSLTLALGALLVPLLLGATGTAFAGACGDDVNGERIPCSCGDVVVSDTRLQPTDPVTTERCRRDGLFLRAPIGLNTIRLDLAGLSILGSSMGYGVRVVEGGMDGGAVITGGDGAPAQIVAFETGVFAHGSVALAELSNVELLGNSKDGAVIRVSGARISKVAARRNGRDGLRISGHASELSEIEAESNRSTGLQLDGSATNVEALLSDNGEDGARIGGRGHDLRLVTSARNGGHGIVLSGAAHKIDLGGARDAEGADIVGPGVARSEVTR